LFCANISLTVKNSLINKTDGGKATIPTSDKIHNQPVLLSTSNNPLTDFIFFDENILKIFPEVKKNEALTKEWPIT
jgi:hypothetical protein